MAFGDGVLDFNIACARRDCDTARLVMEMLDITAAAASGKSDRAPLPFLSVAVIHITHKRSSDSKNGSGTKDDADQPATRNPRVSWPTMVYAI